MGIGQHLETIAAYVDYISPMVYPSTFSDGIPVSPGYRNAVAYPYEIVFYSLEKAEKRLRGTGAKLAALAAVFRRLPLGHRAGVPDERDRRSEEGCGGRRLRRLAALGSNCQVQQGRHRSSITMIASPGLEYPGRQRWRDATVQAGGNCQTD